MNSVVTWGVAVIVKAEGTLSMVWTMSAVLFLPIPAIAKKESGLATILPFFLLSIYFFLSTTLSELSNGHKNFCTSISFILDELSRPTLSGGTRIFAIGEFI